MPLTLVTLPGGHGLGVLVPDRRVKENRALAVQIRRLKSAKFLREHASWLERARIDQLVAANRLRAGLDDTREQLARRESELAEVVAKRRKQREEVVELTAVTKKLDAALTRAQAELRQHREHAPADQTVNELRARVAELDAVIGTKESELEALIQQARMMLRSRSDFQPPTRG